MHVTFAHDADSQFFSHSQANLDDWDFLDAGNDQRVTVVVRPRRAIDERIHRNALDLELFTPDRNLDDPLLAHDAAANP
jgi:hypothetical protein